jgi:hypothetical protein
MPHEPSQPAPAGFRLYQLAEDILAQATQGSCDSLLSSTEALQSYAAERYGIAISQADADLVRSRMSGYLEREANNDENDWYGDIYLALS